MTKLSQIVLILLLIPVISGCSTVSYYHQAVTGQLSLMMSARPVSEILSDPATRPELRSKLDTAMAARSFAGDRLALPVGDAFLDFAELDRPYIVVNLVAVPEFSLEPHQWCYPFVGCQAYRGYFAIDGARQEQQQFDQDGYDTFIGGVTAYSTLGWFDDPLHSGFTRLDDDRMAALIFHELSHRVIYIEQDTAFNESFATAVELEGLRLWLEHQGHSDGFRSALERLDHRNQTLALVESSAALLNALYQHPDDLTEVELRSRKAAILADLRHRYLELARNWSQPGPFGVNPPPLNNANIALFRQYNQHVPGFRQLLRDHRYDFTAFFQAVGRLSQLPPAERRDTLLALAERFDEHL